MDETPETNPLIVNQPTDKNFYDDLLKKYAEDLKFNVVSEHYTMPTTITSFPNYHDQYSLNHTIPSPVNWNTVIYSDNLKTYQVSPQVGKHDSKVEVRMDDNSVEHITREELVKYISERKAIRENPLVRKLYERLQVALKLSRSDDNGETGI